MKVTVHEKQESKEIDWSKPMVVRSSSNDYVITNGRHEDDFFNGIRLDDGHYTEDWPKNSFTPITEPLTITFENE